MRRVGDKVWTGSPHSKTGSNVTESDTKEESQGVRRSGGEGAGQKRRHGLCTEDMIKPGALSSV